MEVNRTVHFFFLYYFNSYSLLFTHIFYIFANMKTRLSNWLSPKPYRTVIKVYKRFRKEGDIDRLLFFKSFVYTCLDSMAKHIEHGNSFESYIDMVGSDGLYEQVINNYYEQYKASKINGKGYVQLYYDVLRGYILR